MKKVYPEYNRRACPERSRRAFSFMELIVVMGIIAILGAVLVPTIRSFSPTFRLNNSTRLILNKLRQAQEEAIAIQFQHSLRFDLSTNPPILRLIKIEYTETEEVIETELETFELPTNLDVTFDPDTEVKEVKFSSDGGPSWNGDIIVALGGNSKIINISTAGVMKIE